MPSTFATEGSYTTARSGISFIELPRMAGTFATGQAALTRRWACLWQNWFDFMIDVLGYDEYTPGDSIITRYLPEPDPEVNGFYADDMQLVDPAGVPITDSSLQCLKYIDRQPGGGSPTDGLAIFNVTFRAPLWGMIEVEYASMEDVPELSRYVVRTKEDAVESLVMPTGTLMWGDTQEPVPASAGLLFPTAVYRYMWHRVPAEAEPSTTIEQTMGKVNENEFDGRAPGTLLLMPPQRELYQAANTYTYLNVGYAMNYRPQGWNNFFDPGTGTYREVRRRAAPTVGAYETANFASLFDPSAG